MLDLNSNLIEIARPNNQDALRQVMLVNALSIVGVDANTSKSKFEQLLGPVNGRWDLDRPFKCYQSNGRWITEGVSTCALVCRGLWRRIKVDMNALYNNYVFGTAISAEKQFAIMHNTWIEGQTAGSLIPSNGDYLIIGNNINIHALICIGWNKDIMISVDGGQIDSIGLQCIKQCERRWIIKSDGPYLGTRKVLGWINLCGLPFKDENILVPEHWENVG